MFDCFDYICDGDYELLIDYAFKRCDMFSFCLPNFDRFTQNCESLKDFSLYPDYEQYKNNTAPLREILHDFLIYYEKSKQYLNETGAYDYEIFYYKTDKGACDIIKSVAGLSVWRYPLYPEDLCFFVGDNCWLYSIAHEHICYIYSEDEADENILKQLGASFEEVSECKPPKINIPFI